MQNIRAVFIAVSVALIASGCSMKQNYNTEYSSISAREHHSSKLPGISPTSVDGLTKLAAFRGNWFLTKFCGDNPYGWRCEVERRWHKQDVDRSKGWKEWSCEYGSRCWDKRQRKRRNGICQRTRQWAKDLATKIRTWDGKIQCYP